MKVSADDPMVEWQKALYRAMTDRKSLEVVFKFKRKPNVQGLAAMERALNSWIRGSLKALGVKRPPKFQMDMQSYRHLEDDGTNDVRVELDFAKLFGPAEAAQVKEPKPK